MPAIAELYATVMPETSKIADGIVRAFREVDPKAREAARRWGREIESGLDNVKVELKADTTKAKAEIDAAAHDRHSTIHVNVDKDRLGSEITSGLDRMAETAALSMGSALASAMSSGAMQGFTNIGGAASQAMGSTMTQGFGQAAGAIGAAAGPEGSAIGSTLGNSIMSSLQPILMTGAITALAGIASAVSGLAGLAPAGLAGAGSLVATLAVGLDGVKDAWDAAGKAADSSGKDQEAQTKAVASAQKSLREAVQDEATAQKDVANARRDARQQLEDLNIQMRGGVIDERQAILDAQAARRDLATGRFRDSIEYEQAQLRVEQADQRVLEAHERNVQLQDKATEANSRGVDQSEQVVAANQRLERAHENVATAQQNLAEAQSKTSSAADSASQAMAKLSPNAQAFVGTLLQMKPLWESFKNSVQDALFANLGPQIQKLATAYMPMLQGAFSTLAGLINQGASALMAFLQQPETMTMIQGLLSNLTESFREFMPVMSTIGQAFLQMTSTGAAFLPQLGQIIGQFAGAFAGFVNSGAFGKWLETGLMALQQLTNMLPTLLQMFTDLAPIGTASLGAIGQILTAIQPAIAPLANMFASVINAMSPWWALLTQVASTIVGALVPAVTQMFNAFAPLVQQIVSAFQPVMVTLGPVLAQTAQIFAGAMVPAIQQLIPLVVPLVQQMAQLALTMMPLLPSFMQMATAAIPMLTQSLQLVLPFMTRVMELMTRGASIAIPQLSAAMSTAADLFTKGWNTIKTAVETTWNAIRPIFDMIKNAIHDLGLDKLLGAVSRFLPNLPSLPSVPTLGAGGGGSAPSGFNWDAVMPHEGRTWNNADTGHNGHFGGLQFSPETWKAYGGLEFAPRADLATPEQQKTVADRTAFYGYKGTPPQGLGAWEAITKGMVPGITTSSTPPTLGIPAAPSLVAPGQGVGTFWARNPGAPTQAGTWGALPTAPAATLPVPAVGGAGIPGLNLGTPGKAPEEHLQPGAVTLNRIISQLFPEVTSIGGYRANDPYPDHPSGRALDIMVGNNAALGNAINQYLQQRAAELGIDYTLWQQQTWNPGKGPTMMADRGSPTENHMDHVHAMVKAGAVANPQNLSMPGYYPSAMMPTMASPYGISADGTMPLGTQNSPMYVAPAGNSGGQQLGQDIFSGFLEIFGIDGSLFKNPLDSGLFKGFKGLMSALTGGGRGGGGAGLPASAYASMGGDGAALPALGGGGDLFGGLASAVLGNVAQPYGPLGIGGPAQAPDEYEPLLPGSGGKTVLPSGLTPGKNAGPVQNIDRSATYVLNGTPPPGAMDFVQSVDVPRARQSLTGLPG
ncbi:transglycosylase family protein [Mycobacterium sp. TY813]|uniref:transglycosylase family protein n=1 Tax=Mycobacterium sp. TY813 TaxID=3050579 RepID=UPI0027413685|nr:transglycosylase family protein [Mycobacterium sp. TY813]MDP7729491.1 transglycosylase family protein [Mycobacterium sp. TY813]